MTIYRNDASTSGEVEATAIPTSRGDVVAVYVNHGDGAGEELYWQAVDDYYNLAYHLPQWSIDLWHSKPDDFVAAYPTQDVTSYASSGDLADGIENASANNSLAYLGENNGYYQGRPATAQSDVFGVVSDGGCFVDWDRNDTAWILEPNCETLVISDVDWHLDTTVDADAGLLGARVQGQTGEFWMVDVELVGQRNQPASSDPNNYTVRPHLEHEDIQGLMENVRLPDGEWYSGSGSPGGGSRCLGFSTDPTPDPGHQGQLAMKDCYAESWLGNGYYISMDPRQDTVFSGGETLLWNCEAHNCNRGNMRVGFNDSIIGGHVSVSDMPGDLQGQPLVSDYATDGPSNPTEIIGLKVSGNDYQADGIVFRNHDYLDDAHLRMEKVVLDANGPNRPIRFEKGDVDTLNVEIVDCYFHYRYSNTTNELLGVIGTDVTVPNGDMRVQNDDNHEVEIYTGGSLDIEGNGYSAGSWTADQLGLEDPFEDDGTLPEFYFDYAAAGIAP